MRRWLDAKAKKDETPLTRTARKRLAGADFECRMRCALVPSHGLLEYTDSQCVEAGFIERSDADDRVCGIAGFDGLRYLRPVFEMRLAELDLCADQRRMWKKLRAAYYRQSAFPAIDDAI